MKAFRFIPFLVLFSASQLFSQWLPQSSATTGYLTDVQFGTPQLGIVVGQIGVMRTTDGGATWSTYSTGAVKLYKVKFVNSSVGWAVGWTSGNHGAIMKTNDGGLTWAVQDTSFEKVYMQGVSFVDALHGWIIGSASPPDTVGHIYRTTNGGVSWIPAASSNLAAPNDLVFVDALRGFAVRQAGGIVRSTDGGVTWNEVARALVTYPTGAMNEPLRRIFFVDRDHGWAVGGISGVETKMKTSDGGLTWLTDNISMGGSSLHGVWFTDVNNGWTVGGGVGGLVIKRTIDGGVNWTKQPVPWTNGYFYGVCMTGANEGWVVGDFGRILKTTNGGVTSVGKGETGVPREFALNQNYPNPFNPTTVISYQVPALSVVTIKVFDVLGREVSALVDGVVEPGKYTVMWDGRNSRGDQQSSGIYFYTLSTSERSITKTMVLVK